MPDTKVNIDSVRFERRIGIDGNVETCKLVDITEKRSALIHLDSAIVFSDTTVYFRAYIRDYSSKKWLNPTDWLAIRVNQYSDYQPEYFTIDVHATGKQIYVQTLSLPFLTSGYDTLCIYRNTDSTEIGSTRITLNLVWVANKPVYQDEPGVIGTYYYWLRLKNGNGRLTKKSSIASAFVTGRLEAPPIRRLNINGQAIQVSIKHQICMERTWYQRTADTLISPSDPTLTHDTGFADFPPESGFWYYRTIGALDYKGEERTVFGDWVRSELFSFSDTIISFTPDIKLMNGQVIAQPIGVLKSLDKFYRASDSTGANSVQVDLVRPEWHSLLTDRQPPVGVWYYWHRSTCDECGRTPLIFQSTLVRIEIPETLNTP